MSKNTKKLPKNQTNELVEDDEIISDSEPVEDNIVDKLARIKRKNSSDKINVPTGSLSKSQRINKEIEEDKGTEKEEETEINDEKSDDNDDTLDLEKEFDKKQKKKKTDEDSDLSDFEEEKLDKGEEDDEDEKDVKECIYSFSTAKKPSHEEELIQEEINYVSSGDKSKNTKIASEHITKDFLTKYERVRILGERARQLASGAKPMIKYTEKLDPIAIAKAELEQKVLPFIIERKLPNGSIERWNVRDLKIMN
jgi:DNA-directed RNA polymerase subunit K/omega